MIAAGAYLAARELGLRIPEDLSVIGFDGLELGRILDPPLTTVVADGREMGRVAFELLLAQFAGPSARAAACWRSSCWSAAPPPRRAERAPRGKVARTGPCNSRHT